MSTGCLIWGRSEVQARVVGVKHLERQTTSIPKPRYRSQWNAVVKIANLVFCHGTNGQAIVNQGILGRSGVGTAKPMEPLEYVLMDY